MLLIMLTALHIKRSGAARFRAAFMMGLVLLAVVLGSVADSFHVHQIEVTVQSASVETDDGADKVIGDIDCGIHPGCSAILIPDNPILSDHPVADGGEPIIHIRRISATAPAPDHPPTVA